MATNKKKNEKNKAGLGWQELNEILRGFEINNLLHGLLDMKQIDSVDEVENEMAIQLKEVVDSLVHDEKNKTDHDASATYKKTASIIMNNREFMREYRALNPCLNFSKEGLDLWKIVSWRLLLSPEFPPIIIEDILNMAICGFQNNPNQNDISHFLVGTSAITVIRMYQDYYLKR